MRTTARIIGIELLAIESDGDHIHLMIAYTPNLTLSEIVRRLKGASSRSVRLKRFTEVLKKLWGIAFWSPSYFIVSCGGAPLEVIKSYVENQQTPYRQKNKKIDSGLTPATSTRKSSLHHRTEVQGFVLEFDKSHLRIPDNGRTDSCLSYCFRRPSHTAPQRDQPDPPRGKDNPDSVNKIATGLFIGEETDGEPARYTGERR